MIKNEKLLRFVNRFSGTKVFVLGDLMVDKYIYGRVSRISPEAPVPVVEVVKETAVPGGAGNVASNIVSLGGKCFLGGIVGADLLGETLIAEFSKQGVNTEGVICDNSRPTTLKTRIIAHHQQVVRCDWENVAKISPQLNNKIVNYLKKVISEIQVIVISDYGKGVISPSLLSKIIRLGRQYSKPVVVDPKVEHFLRYRRVTCITPNLNEAIVGMRWHRAEREGEIRKLGEKVLRKLNCQSVLITRGERGMTLFQSTPSGAKIQITNIPTAAREVFDVTGAGDTVVSVLSLGLASGLEIREAAYLANYAAGIVVGKLGTATVSPEELRKAIRKAERTGKQ